MLMAAARSGAMFVKDGLFAVTRGFVIASAEATTAGGAVCSGEALVGEAVSDQATAGANASTASQHEDFEKR